METFKPTKGIGIYYLIGMMFLYDALFILGIMKVNSYIISIFIKISLVVFTAYLLYYILIYSTLSYFVDSDYIYIRAFIRNVKIAFKDIECYKITVGNISGVKLSGFGTNNFALGKSVIKKIGTTNMFVTSNKKVVYLKVGELNYALSPKNSERFVNALVTRSIVDCEWEQQQNKQVSLHRDRGFMVPFLIASLIITILTLNPFILYLSNKLPSSMPLNFDSAFFPVDKGTGKQFAFNQMIYGVMNMAILFCMYYASHFYAKYDKKSAKKFIYISLIIALSFLLIQLRILHTFR